jgi:pimeloyl-ACP methyl ester carboxylesterase
MRQTFKVRVPTLRAFFSASSSPSGTNSYPTCGDAVSTFALNRQRLQREAASFYSHNPCFIRVGESQKLICYEEYGDPSGVPVVVYHGNPGSRVFAAIFHKQFARHKVRALAFDRPGCGFSPVRPEAPGALEDHADDIMRVCDALQLPRVSLVSWDLSSSYAVATAARHSERVASLHMLAPYPPLHRLPPEVEAVVTESDKTFRDLSVRYGVWRLLWVYRKIDAQCRQRPLTWLHEYAKSVLPNVHDELVLTGPDMSSVLLDDMQVTLIALNNPK